MSNTPTDLSQAAVLKRAYDFAVQHARTYAICDRYTSLCARRADCGTNREAFAYYAPDVLVVVRLALLQYILQPEGADGPSAPAMVNELLEAWNIEPATSDVFEYHATFGRVGDGHGARHPDGDVIAVTESGFVLRWLDRDLDSLTCTQPPGPPMPKTQPGQHDPRRVVAALQMVLWPLGLASGGGRSMSDALVVQQVENVLKLAGYGPPVTTVRSLRAAAEARPHLGAVADADDCTATEPDLATTDAPAGSVP